MLSEDVSKNSSDMQTYRTNFEKEAAKKIKDTLETIMGKDNVSVQVSTVMDFNQTRSTIESYTPSKGSENGVIMTQQGEKEIYSKPQDLPSNAKNQDANLANQPEPTQAQILAQNQMNNIANEQNQNPTLNTQQAASTAQNVVELPLNETPAKTVNYVGTRTGDNEEDARKLSYEKEKQATTYAVTKEIKQVVYAPGSVVKMSVAVAVNKILTDNEKKEIENLVIAAAGMDSSRGDVVNVSSLKFTGIDLDEELKQSKLEQKEFTMEVLTFIFKNVAPVFIILLLGLLALYNFGNVFKEPKPEVQEENENEEEAQLPTYDPYLMLQQNNTNSDDFYNQDMQFASALDKKKNDIINMILENPEEAGRVITSYLKE